MYGQRKTRTKGDTKYLSHKYICASYHTKGKSVCNHHAVDQAQLLAVLIRKLQGRIGGDGGREALRTRVLERRQSVDPGDVAAQRSRLDELDAKIDRAADNYLDADVSIRGILGKKMGTMRADRDRVAAELAAIEGVKPTDLEGESDRITDRVWGLHEELDRAKPARLREVINQMVEKIDLFFGSIQKKSRTEHPLARGEITLRPDPGLQFSKHVSRGDWIRTSDLLTPSLFNMGFMGVLSDVRLLIRVDGIRGYRYPSI